jgi:hypothetical protein
MFYPNLFPSASLDRDQSGSLYNWSILGEVFGRPWFRRVWTLQELVLSDPDKAIVLCGKTFIEWSAFKSAIECMRAVNFDEWRIIWDAIELFLVLRQHVVTRRSGLYTIARISENLPSSGIPILFLTHIFATARRKEATDPKDIIFALYGLCTELGVQMPTPEYNKTLEQIYCEATKAIIRFDRNLEVLYYINTPRRRIELPSWVPDWNDSWNTEGLHPIRISPLFKAAPAKAFYSFDPTCRVLTTLGKAIDAISLVGGRFPCSKRAQDRGDQIFTTRGTLTGWREIFSCGGLSRDGLNVCKNENGAKKTAVMVTTVMVMTVMMTTVMMTTSLDIVTELHMSLHSITPS